MVDIFSTFFPYGIVNRFTMLSLNRSVIITSCNHSDIFHKMALDMNVVYITLIVCISVLAVIWSFLVFLYFNSKKRVELEKKVNDLKEEKKRFDEKLQKKDKSSLSKEEQKELEDKEIEARKENVFMEHCYKMAISLEKGNEKQKEECWKIILHNHIDYIPEVLKESINKKDKN